MQEGVIHRMAIVIVLSKYHPVTQLGLSLNVAKMFFL